ncbi:MAG TPA: YceI family protein [Polyangia bacterium]
MKNLKLLTMGLAGGLLAFSGSASAADWVIDPAHSTAEFGVKHMMLTTVKGHFEKVAGTVNLDEKDPTKSSVEVKIDANSINTREPNRDKHLRSADFFDVAKHPELVFKSTKIEKAGKDKYKVTGDFTMRGVTKPIVLQVNAPNKELKNPWGVPTRAVTATGKINRKDWGLEWNKALEAGGVLVGDEVALDIQLELNPPKAPPAAGEKLNK